MLIVIICVLEFHYGQKKAMTKSKSIISKYFSNFSFQKLAFLLATLSVITISFALGFHNASLYNPNHGFDGSGHIYYIEYVNKNNKIPPPTEWETHQPPLYYIVSALILRITDNIKSIQYINIFVHWLIVCMVGLGLYKVLKDKTQVLLGMLSLVALPMLNIFPPMVSNELLSTFFIISAIVAAIYLQYATTKKQFIITTTWLTVSLVLAVWTKISVVTILPTVIFALFLVRKVFSNKTVITTIISVLVIFGLAYLPIFIRADNSQSPSDIVGTVSAINKIPRPSGFYYRLDWIPKVDMYTTQYYSLLGGGWNSFWSDGHNVITPFVPFHKKAFILWTLGFILLPISLYGLFRLLKTHRLSALVIIITGISMLTVFVLINAACDHYSAVRLTYEMAIIIPYAFGIAAAAKNNRLVPVITLLLLIQFIIMVSFFWIQPWWFQAT